MAVLLLRLAGPMQSWGTQSRFVDRDTGLEPSKSGVLGLVCAALGIDREDDAALARLAECRLGVRVDREGAMSRDYHTAGGGSVPGRRTYGVAKASGGTPDAVVSTRHYLADASFLVGLEHADRAMLERIDACLDGPFWPIYLGRKSFVPGEPVRVIGGLRTGTLEDVLRAEPWRPRTAREREGVLRDGLRMVIESVAPTPEVRMDQPLSFANGRRRCAVRYVSTSVVAGESIVIEEEQPCTSLA
ncbi:MAG TPA: type I-E CRISPR-associated protein Cas5/CasD [Armatimonadota bacterium]|nr:type I-E CRISPR-associated protein Cas5/CasD [Armatimonadota bacterium]HQK95560.1 type I-E CRISPR-associated protein Cas5/CasD [Armatimonadota bacterium]